jgi:hypothetical protein
MGSVLENSSAVVAGRHHDTKLKASGVGKDGAKLRTFQRR